MELYESSNKEESIICPLPYKLMQLDLDELQVIRKILAKEAARWNALHEYLNEQSILLEGYPY